MTHEVTGAFLVNPRAVEFELNRATFMYPRRGEADLFRGWGQFAAIPSLFKWMTQLRRFPSLVEAVAFLMEHCDPLCADDPLVRRRGEKLAMDFAREMHTFGLLNHSDIFAYVAYQKALDLGYNVDFVADLLSTLVSADKTVAEAVGIQAMMRWRWPDTEGWGPIREARRLRRGIQEWMGPMYRLTNEYRDPVQKIQGCWLFGPEHIRDLADIILADLTPAPVDVPSVGIQTELVD